MASGTIPKMLTNNLDRLTVRQFSFSGDTAIRINSTDMAAYLFVMLHRANGDRKPYVAVVSYYSGDVQIQQLTTNTHQLTASGTTTSGAATGFKVVTPGYMTGFVIGMGDFEVSISAS